MSSIRSEKRVVRPFAGLGDVEACLKSTQLALNDEPLEESSIAREASELAEDEFHLILNVDADAIAAAVERMQIPEVDVGIAVIATGRSLKATTILHQSPVLAGVLPSTIALSALTYPDVFGDLRGFDVRVCVVLLHDLQPKPLKPYMAGTWLASRDFSVSARGDILAGFNPQRLTDEERAAYGLPQGSVTYLDVSDSILESSDLADSLKFFIDSGIFDLLHANQSGPLGQAMQIDYAIEFIMGALAEIVREINESDLAGSEDTTLNGDFGAGALVFGVAQKLQSTPAKVCADIRSNPARLRSQLQAALELTKSLRKALNQGGE